MKKPGVLLCLLFILVALSFVSAQTTNQSVDEKAYSCLESKFNNSCAKLTLEQKAFSLLALAYNSDIQSDCKKALEDTSQNKTCWPAGACKIKDTALAVLALDYTGQDTIKSEEWLLSKNITPTELEWYMQIDSTEATRCNLTAGSEVKAISIGENKKISGNPGACFSLAYDNYWLKIQPSCISKNFSISCDKGFVSSIMYKKTGSSVWQISSQVKSESAYGITNHKIDVLCLSTGNKCDYEGTLWAAVALQKTANDISKFTPYILALAEDYPKLFPSAFIHKTTKSDSSLRDIASSQKTQGYWDLGDKGKFYDTALAMFSLDESEAQTAAPAKTWLQDNQGADGCWNSGNTRDTAFLLFAGWPKPASGITIEPGQADCEPTYSCIDQGDCAFADRLDYYCSGMEVCCRIAPVEQSCAEKRGTTCSSGQECDGAEVTASNTNYCCLGNCTTIPTATECVQNDYECKSECATDETEVSYSCNAGEFCCKPSVTPTPEGKSNWWIWLLVILIILVILGILFRNKLRVLLFSLTSKFKKKPAAPARPAYPPTAPPISMRRMMPMARPPYPTRPVPAKPATRTDKELEETLKKLKDMSK